MLTEIFVRSIFSGRANQRKIAGLKLACIPSSGPGLSCTHKARTNPSPAISLAWPVAQVGARPKPCLPMGDRVRISVKIDYPPTEGPRVLANIEIASVLYQNLSMNVDLCFHGAEITLTFQNSPTEASFWTDLLCTKAFQSSPHKHRKNKVEITQTFQNNVLTSPALASCRPCAADSSKQCEARIRDHRETKCLGMLADVLKFYRCDNFFHLVASGLHPETLASLCRPTAPNEPKQYVRTSFSLKSWKMPCPLLTSRTMPSRRSISSCSSR